MLMRTDPFRELDQLTQQVLGSGKGTWSKPATMPMDAYRVGDEFVVAFDLPGVPLDAVELNIERNVLTVKAERRPGADRPIEMQVCERPLGVFTRQLFPGDALDTERIDASYEAGVLTLRIRSGRRPSHARSASPTPTRGAVRSTRDTPARKARGRSAGLLVRAEPPAARRFHVGSSIASAPGAADR